MTVNNSCLSSDTTGCAPYTDFALTNRERWYVVHTLAQREFFAQKQLNNQSFRTFLPQYEKTARHARKVVRKLAPLFRGYLFIILDLERDRWHAVNGTLGVSSLVASRDRPMPVPNGVVETLISMRSSDLEAVIHPVLELGQKVRLVSGPFADQFGILQHLDDCGRVRVLLQMMGAWHTVRLSRGDLLPAK